MEAFDLRCVAPFQVTCYLHVVYACILIMYMYLCKHCGHFLFHYNYVCMYADSMLLPPTNYLCMYVLISQFYIATHSTQRMSLYVIVFRCIPQYFIV